MFSTRAGSSYDRVADWILSQASVGILSRKFKRGGIAKELKHGKKHFSFEISSDKTVIIDLVSGTITTLTKVVSYEWEGESDSYDDDSIWGERYKAWIEAGGELDLTGTASGGPAAHDPPRHAVTKVEESSKAIPQEILRLVRQLDIEPL